MFMPPKDSPVGFARPACLTIVVVVVGLTTFATIFVATAGLDWSVLTLFAFGAAAAGTRKAASRFTPPDAATAAAAFHRSDFSAFASFSSLSATSSASLSISTKRSHRPFTVCAASFTLLVNSTCVSCAAWFSLLDFFASLSFAGGAYFCSLTTALPHPVSFSAATDTGMRSSVSNIFNNNDDLCSPLANSNHFFITSKPSPCTKDFK
mmetsp:Transcript_6046/g.20102  ORF Transcript_6046/g.20102 Transcript_6046/m.20102 type:complete len:208 (+) Transcript_6046:1368-1991(+)